jgi:hypothetical protein
MMVRLTAHSVCHLVRRCPIAVDPEALPTQIHFSTRDLVSMRSPQYFWHIDLTNLQKQVGA